MQDEEITYRSPVTVGDLPTASNRDEREISTLLEVQKHMHKLMESIDNVHVFDLTEKEMTVKQQIKAYKKAQELLEPLMSQVDSAIENVQIMQEERSN